MRVSNLELSNIQIPDGCTHWIKSHFDKSRPAQYRFYKVCGPENEEVLIYWGKKWIHFEEYQQWLIDNVPHIKKKIALPDFNSPFMNRFCETANDKVKRIAEKLS